MLVFAAVLLALLLGLLLLPVVLHLRVERADPAGPLGVELGCALFAGLAGLQVESRQTRWHYHPWLLGRRVTLWGAGRRARPGRAQPVASPAPPPTGAAPGQAPGATSGPGPEPVLQRLSGMAHLAGRPAWRLARGVAGAFRLRRVCVRGSFGFADPARTGSVFGYLQALRAVVPRRLRLDLRPDFERPGVRGEATLLLHLYLGYLLFVVLRYGLQVGWRWLRGRLAFRPLVAKPRTA